MRKVVSKTDNRVIMIDEARDRHVILAKRDDFFAGMIVKEKDKGYIHRTSCTTGSSGYFETIEECIEASEKIGFDFFVEDFHT